MVGTKGRHARAPGTHPRAGAALGQLQCRCDALQLAHHPSADAARGLHGSGSAPRGHDLSGRTAPGWRGAWFHAEPSFAADIGWGPRSSHTYSSLGVSRMHVGPHHPNGLADLESCLDPGENSNHCRARMRPVPSTAYSAPPSAMMAPGAHLDRSGVKRMKKMLLSLGCQTET